MNTTHASTETEETRLQKIKELSADIGENWADGFEPGTLGCHELLDRANLLADNVEQYVLDHPSCIQNPEWYALADHAVSALRELYQHIGAEH